MLDPQFAPGERIQHSEFGVGVVLDAAHDGYRKSRLLTNGRRHIAKYRDCKSNIALNRFAIEAYVPVCFLSFFTRCF